MTDLIAILKRSEVFNEAFAFLEKSALPNWFICAGFIQQITKAIYDSKKEKVRRHWPNVRIIEWET